MKRNVETMKTAKRIASKIRMDERLYMKMGANKKGYTLNKPRVRVWSKVWRQVFLANIHKKH